MPDHRFAASTARRICATQFGITLRYLAGLISSPCLYTTLPSGVRPNAPAWMRTRRASANHGLRVILGGWTDPSMLMRSKPVFVRATSSEARSHCG